MLDKNGIEIKKGDTVEITGAYFKNDNGLWKVEHAPGDENWYGKDYCLKRLKKDGTPSTAKHNICFWPLIAVVNSRIKRMEARAHNAEHAQIEVIG
jgi:beta-lactamase class D